MRSLKTLLKLLALILSSSSAIAGAWLQEKDQGEIIFNYQFFSSNENYDQFGNKQINSGFIKNEISPYIEYGIDEDLTIGGALSYQSVVTVGGNQSSDDLDVSYYELFARTYLLEDPDYVLSIEPRVKVPVNANAAINPEGDDPIPELKLAAGTSFKLFDEYSFIDVAGTYRWRDEDELNNKLKDMLKLEATLGLKVEEDSLILAQVFREKSLGRKTADNTPGNFDLTKLQLSLAYDYWETLFMQAGYFNNVDGVNTSAGDGVIFSLWYKF